MWLFRGEVYLVNSHFIFKGVAIAVDADEVVGVGE
jgi:hypothetical protein